MSAPAEILVIPCYNERERLDPAAVAALLERPSVSVLLVDDGSKDGTPELLAEIAAAHPGRCWDLPLERNQGKAEAVRQGLLAAIERGGDVVGFADADFATPPDELQRLLQVAETSGANVVLGARVQRLGTDIRRSRSRHYLGRLFATAASLSLGLRVYDTQCGAKVFRRTPELLEALSQPFASRWIFDVEFIGRLLDAGYTDADFVEVPLHVWHDVAGSKLGPSAMVKAGLDLAGIAWQRRRRR